MRRLQGRSDGATPGPAPINPQWLTLEAASRRLGVHPATLRRWADEGAIDLFVTPGGHRRFLVASLERFAREHYRNRLPAGPQQELAEHAIAHTREEIPKQQWVAPYGDEEREAQRRLGRRLIGLTLQYIADPGDSPDLLAEARAIGAQHARTALDRGQPLLDLLQAISFFRTTVIEVALLESPRATAAQSETSMRLLRRIERLINEVQSGVVELYLAGTETR